MDNRSWDKEIKSDISVKVISFFISPFLSFLYSLRRINTKSSYVVFFLFALFYGLCYTVLADEGNVIESSDAAKWRARFEDIDLNTWEDYITYIVFFFSRASDAGDFLDIYFPTIALIVNQFSHNYHVFFFAIALVFSFFQLKSFRFLTKSPYFDNSVFCFLLCVFFNFNDISNIGGFRFCTAAWIGVFSLLQIYINNNKWYYLVFLFMPLVHRGFFFMYPVILLALFTKKKRFWVIVFYGSIFLSSLSLVILQSASDYLPSFMSRMVETYSSNNISEEYSFTKYFLITISTLYVNALLFISVKARNKLREDNFENLLDFSILFMAIVNFTMAIPSVGVRFILMAEPLIAILFLNACGQHKKKIAIVYFMPLFMIRALYVGIFSFFRYQDIEFFVMNPFYLIYSHL